MTRAVCLLSSLATILLAGCGGPQMDASQMTAARPVDLGAIEATMSPSAGYRIGVGDRLNVRVFQVPDLSVDNLLTDTSGNIQMPLIGAVRSAGLTPDELSVEIAARLSERYLRNPQVTVTVTAAASQKVTVDGAVTKPGVYEMRGATSLLQSIAMAEGPTRIADLTKVAVFRTIDGQRSVAVFDLAAIRQGRAADPQVFGDDIIVVDTSRLSARMQDVVSLIPALAIFRAY
ncbi:MAG: polysaccharide export protein [Brevundimonas sp.]|nr:polysaccharide export protein [Brevundimonas sp.]